MVKVCMGKVVQVLAVIVMGLHFNVYSSAPCKISTKPAVGCCRPERNHPPAFSGLFFIRLSQQRSMGRVAHDMLCDREL